MLGLNTDSQAHGYPALHPNSLALLQPLPKAFLDGAKKESTSWGTPRDNGFFQPGQSQRHGGRGESDACSMAIFHRPWQLL